MWAIPVHVLALSVCLHIGHTDVTAVQSARVVGAFTTHLPVPLCLALPTTIPLVCHATIESDVVMEQHVGLQSFTERFQIIASHDRIVPAFIRRDVSASVTLFFVPCP